MRTVPLFALSTVTSAAALSFGCHSISSAHRLSKPCMMAVDEVAVAQQQLEALQQQLQILELKAKIAKLQDTATTAAPSQPLTPQPIIAEPVPMPAVTAVTPPPPVQVVTPPPTQVPAPVAVYTPPPVVEVPQVAAAPPVVATPPVTPAIDTAMVSAPPPAVEKAAEVAAASSSSSDPNLVPIIATLALVPIGYFAATKAIEFVNSRYDEIQEGREPASPSSFAPASKGNVLANRMMAERQAQTEVERANLWDTGGAPPGGTRNAIDIFSRGLENLLEDPTGWRFGPPSALYSNLPIAPPPAPRAAPGPAAGAFTAGRVVPSAAPSPVPSSNPAKKGKKGKKARRARVPPSTPEELELARRGEWKYGQDE